MSFGREDGRLLLRMGEAAEVLVAAGYRLERVQPVDLFPQTMCP